MLRFVSRPTLSCQEPIKGTMAKDKSADLKSFLEIPYEELEEMNLKAAQRAEMASAKELEQEYTAWLRKEKQIKAVTLCFSDIEGRLHMLDYDGADRRVLWKQACEIKCSFRQCIG